MRYTLYCFFYQNLFDMTHRPLRYDTRSHWAVPSRTFCGGLEIWQTFRSESRRSAIQGMQCVWIIGVVGSADPFELVLSLCSSYLRSAWLPISFTNASRSKVRHRTGPFAVQVAVLKITYWKFKNWGREKRGRGRALWKKWLIAQCVELEMI